MVETYARPEFLPDHVDPGAWAHLRSVEVRSRYNDMMCPSTFVEGTGHLLTFMAERDLVVLPPDPLTGPRVLNHEIYGAFDYGPGFTAADSPIDAALQHRKGVCQDFAHIMLAVARHWGIPSRYVSGNLARTQSKPSSALFQMHPTPGLNAICLNKAGSVLIQPTLCWLAIAMLWWPMALTMRMFPQPGVSLRVMLKVC
ncbi:hypothetical protein PsB1_2145 [Candidatus Phycosocius spiralis]|uniref:Transglutaminase-like domain-containing protein n=1 Tax=Candidatus Phycosocius spiralis TaxID=2815099 RepID=A0ABQ4PY43_9PROT|nr:transglutaminase-like domain-containing protein [Candidatus Phycosocius spiralis]GIU67991.1 hypothetical protein PsB1_2145 [Candidatus Phycosocius spiralis]